MIIGIIVAMDREMNLLLPLMEVQDKTHVNGFEFYSGSIGAHGVVACKCGIGKVNAAIGTLTLLDTFHPDRVINTGVAGGADPSMHVLDLLVATGVEYCDVWCGPGTPYGAAAGFEAVFQPSKRIVELAEKCLAGKPNLKFGLIASGDKFITTASEVADIKSHLPRALAVDMESGAIAQVCTMRSVPFSILRVISDTPGQEENISQYENFWTEAPAETFTALRTLLEALK